MVWSADEVVNFDAMAQEAERLHLTPQDWVKQAIAAFLSSRDK